MINQAANNPSSSSTTTTTVPNNLTFLSDSIDVDFTNCENPVSIIQRAASDFFGRQLPPALLKQALFYADKMDPWVVGEAIRAASEAPSPSWRYAVAVMARCVRDGVKNYEDWCERDLRFRSGRY